MSERNINNLRDKINTIDNKMLDLLGKRSELVSEIGRFKDKLKGVVDSTREKEILDRILKKYNGKYSKDSIIRIWRELFCASSQLQIRPTSLISTKRSISEIQIYKGGKSNVKDIQNIIKLSSNENAFGPTKQIRDISTLLNNLNKYPEINGKTLRGDIAKFNNIIKDQIVLGNGSDEILLMAAISFCQSGDEIIHAQHGFEMYPIIAKVVGAVSKVALEDNYKISINSIKDQITEATKIIYIANPNNPTGTYLNNKELKDLLTGIPSNIIVVIDGAYSEYVKQVDYDNSFDLLNNFENIIITRTFSKVYGLASLRLGWCYTSAKIASILNKVKTPFNTNAFAQNIASIALLDQQHINYVIEENDKNKKWFENELKILGISALKSFANFSFIETTEKKALEIFNALMKNGIIIRQLNSYHLPHCLRVTIGTKEDMSKTIEVLKKITK